MFKVSKNRWAFAQKAERDYQQNKLISFKKNPNSYINLAKNKSKYVIDLFASINIDITNVISVAEIGSGSHGMIWFFPAKKKYAIDPLADYYFENYSELQNNSSNIDVMPIMAESLPIENNSVDLFITENVLDHTSDPLRVVNEAYRCLNNKSYMYCLVDIHSNFWFVLSLFYNFIFKIGIKINMPAFPAHPHHFRKKDVEKIFKNNNFKIVWSRTNRGERANNIHMKEKIKRLLGKNQAIEIIAYKR